MIYLDNAATTRPYDEVIEEIKKAQELFFANPSSMHAAGYEAEKKISDAKSVLFSAIGADVKGKNGELLFTSGGTESNNLAFFGLLQNSLKRKPHIITTKIEHPSVLEPVKFLESLGAEVTFVSPDENGFISPDSVLDAVQDNTKIVSVMLVNNETGAIAPISEISKKVKAKNKDILIHTDCVQAFGNTKIDVVKMGIDMLSLSAHKIHGPKGVGGLFVAKGVNLKPFLLGGHQQSNLRSGTLNTSGILGFSKAAEIMKKTFDEKQNLLLSLKERLIDNLKGNELFSINNEGDGYSPHILSLRVKNVRAEVLLHALEVHGICISAGSACSSNRPAPSHVLEAMGYSKKHIEETVRISTGAFNTLDDIDTFCEILKKEAQALSKFTRI